MKDIVCLLDLFRERVALPRGAFRSLAKLVDEASVDYTLAVGKSTLLGLVFDHAHVRILAFQTMFPLDLQTDGCV